MKNYTYEDFASGEIAIFNDNVEKTRLLCKKSFPSHGWEYPLVNLYYTSKTWPVDQWSVRHNNDTPQNMAIIPASQISLEPREKKSPVSVESLLKDIEPRKIIGYVVPEDLYGGYLKKGTVVCKCFNGFTYADPKDENNMKDLLIPKEIVEKWQPVYETLKEGIKEMPKENFTLHQMIDFAKHVWYKKSLSDTTHELYDYIGEWLSTYETEGEKINKIITKA